MLPRRKQTMNLTSLTRQALTDTAPGDGVAPRAWRRDEPLAYSLDGSWRFQLSPCLAAAPEDCDAEDFDDETWDRIDLPCHWVLAADGRYGRPSYTNVQLPIPLDAPYVPDRNPIGDHRRTFELPDGWEQHQQILLRFDGVESLGIVAVNGEHVGVLRGSRLPSELDVTDVVHPGTNTVHVRVAQWSAQTYVEDQDQWWLPGIFRSVTLIARPAGCIRDHWIDGGFDHVSGAGTITVDVAKARFPLRLEAPTLGVDVTWDTPDDVRPVCVPAVTPWSADRPQRYAVTLSNAVDQVTEHIGFRSIQVRDAQWLINGTKLRLRGVNRHEYHPTLGRVFDEAACREGLLEMKRHNINAIRTSHYPPHPRLLDMADELGFWVIDECDLETHAFELVDWEGNPTDQPAWRDALVQRMERTVYRDRNHPSIIAWSLGNESGTGANLAAMADVVHRLDPTRLVHYEGDYEAAYSDVVSRMYSPVAEMRAMSDGTTNALTKRPMQAQRFREKPKMLCEFAHAMGNGPGGLVEYVEAFETLPDWHGGFVWEWRDHGIATTTDDGTPYYAYGGDFGEKPHDSNFVMDGLVHSDARPSPALAEVKQQFSPVAISIGDAIAVENRFHAISTSHLIARWRWEVAGTLRAEGSIDGFDVPANSTATFPLPLLDDEAYTLRDSFLTIIVEERDARPWAEAGHPVCIAQHRLDDAPPPSAPRPTAAPLIAHDVHIGPATLCPRSGTLLALGDHAVENAGVELWRAPTDNDSLGDFGSYELGDYLATGGYGVPGPSSAERWRAHGLHRLLRRTTQVGMQGEEFVVTERLIAAQQRHGAEVTYRWSVVGDRACCKVLVAPIRPRSDVTWPRIGFHMMLPASFTHASWFGGGPGEAYPDAHTASIIGCYESTIDDLAFPYSRPQETGHREQLRQLTIDGASSRLQFEAFGPDLPGFSLLRHDAHELTAAAHPHELPPSRGVHLYLDAFQHGLGSRSCGPDVLPQYQLWPRKAAFGFLVGIG